jgi:deoxyadenosine/deoxycytidine kinase
MSYFPTSTNVVQDNTHTPYLLVAIEGNIGVGKTTLLDALEQYYQSHTNVIILREPVTQWEQMQNEHGESILSQFYHHPTKYAFSFQVLVFQTLQQMFQETISTIQTDHKGAELGNQKTTIIFCERSLLSSRFIFERMLVAQQSMNLLEHQIYEMLYNDPMTHLFPHLVIYLECPPQICMERILQRNRHGETNITLDYLTLCHTYYEQHLFHLVKSDNMEPKKRILRVDVSKYDFDSTNIRQVEDTRENPCLKRIHQIEAFCQLFL